MRLIQPIYKMSHDNAWIIITEKEMMEWQKTDVAKYEHWDNIIYEHQINPISFFLPHGINNYKYKLTEGHAFLNDWEHDLVLLLAGNQTGKAQPYDSVIQTPSGPVKMGNLKIGDFVFGGNGKPCRVRNIFEQGIRPVYRVEFDDGEVSTECDIQHNWKYLVHHNSFFRKKEKNRGKAYNLNFNKWQVLTLGQIMIKQGIESTPQNRGYIPVCSPVEFVEKKKLMISPYVMGVLLGDGSLAESIAFSSSDSELIERVRKELPSFVELKYYSDYDYRIKNRSKLKVDKLGRYSTCSFRNEIRRLKLMGTNCFTKFIPDEYKYLSAVKRMDLLRGLMDTDGCISSPRCTMEYCTVSERLAHDVAWLVRSLGGKCKTKTRYTYYTYKNERRKGALSYRLTVKMQQNPFWLSRKAKRFYPIKRRPDRLLYRIIPAGEKRCRCISVDSSDQTYLTDDFIVTHNTTHGIAYLCLHGLIPTNPDWQIFTKHGVEYREWMGPKIAIVSSWSWDNTVDIYNAYLRWLPRKELGAYAPNWGKFEGENGRQRVTSFGAKVAKELELECGSKIIFLCYTQNQIHWEGKQCDIAHCDEQPPEDKIDGLFARQLTRGSYTPIAMTLTGHILPGRPDTGAGGWIKTKMIDLRLTKGRKFAVYHLSVPSTPDAIMSPEQKERTRIQWVVEPQKTRNFKKINEGIARYMGGWEQGGGLIFNEWNPQIHRIDSFDLLPYKPTFYRMIDHGKEPCAALLFAKMPWGDTVIFKEYYMYGKSITDNARIVVEELCGNKLVLVDEYVEEGQTWNVYEEKPVTMEFEASELDGRSFAMPSMVRSQTIGAIWNMGGCACLPATCLKDNQVIPLVQELFSLRRNRPHINVRLNRRYDKKLEQYGAPLLYLFNGLVNLEAELNSYMENPETNKPIGNNDHLLSCLKFYAGRDRPYRRPVSAPEGEENIRDSKQWSLGTV